MNDSNHHALAGKLTGNRHQLPIRIYFEDTDFTGIVYHANYLKFCERGRSDMLRLLGIDHCVLASQGLGFAVTKMNCQFLSPARIDDLISVDTSLAELTAARIRLNQQISRGDVILFSALVEVVLIDPQGRPKRLPQDLKQCFSNLS